MRKVIQITESQFKTLTEQLIGGFVAPGDEDMCKIEKPDNDKDETNDLPNNDYEVQPGAEYTNQPPLA